MTLLGRHPRGLAILFGTEMWERLSYYGMRALLVGYLVKYLLLPGRVEHVLFYPEVKAFYEFFAGPLAAQPLSSMIYGSYTGFIYATPLLGGWLADRWFGQRAVAMAGIAMMAAGHFMMASEALLFPALLLLIIGGGFFKTNTTAQVGLLYGKDDPRRAGAYSIFYLGINLGGVLGPLVCGTLGEMVGWHWGFGAAGVGMLLALAIYLLGWKHLPPEPLRAKASATSEKLSATEWKSIGALFMLCVPLTLYWACNEQQGNSIALWALDNTDRGASLLGRQVEIPFTWFQSLNPAVILVITPLLIAMWQARGRQPSPLMKMVYGCLLMAAANVMMALAAWHLGTGKAHWLWLAAYFVVMTVGEIYLYPSSLALYSRVAPLRLASFMMAVNFIPNFLGGGLLQGYLGAWWETMDKAAFFVLIAALAAVAAAIIWAYERPLRPYLEDRAA